MHHLQLFVTHHRLFTLACAIGLLIGVEGVCVLWMALKPRRTPAAVKALRARRAPRPVAREMTAVYHVPIAATGRHRAPEPEPEPAPAPAPEPETTEPVEHQGATADWSPMAAVADVGPGHTHPTDLILADVEADERRLAAERESRIDEFAIAQPVEYGQGFYTVLNRLNIRCARVEEALASADPGRTFLALAVDEPTGAWSTQELRQLLAAEDAESAARTVRGNHTSAKRLRHRANRAQVTA